MSPWVSLQGSESLQGLFQHLDLGFNQLGLLGILPCLLPQPYFYPSSSWYSGNPAFPPSQQISKTLLLLPSDTP